MKFEQADCPHCQGGPRLIWATEYRQGYAELEEHGGGDFEMGWFHGDSDADIVPMADDGGHCTLVCGECRQDWQTKVAVLAKVVVLG